MSFVKTDPAPLEAAGLRWLAEAGARVPAILEERRIGWCCSGSTSAPLTAAGEEDLGRMLAELHEPARRASARCPRPAGSSSAGANCDSPEGDDWNDYYLEHRCLPLARRVGLEREVAARTGGRAGRAGGAPARRSLDGQRPRRRARACPG